MPIIDSNSNVNKFDVLIRVNKADSLMSFIMATRNSNSSNDKKTEIMKRLKSSYELFREDIKGSSTGAGTYGTSDDKIKGQFESQYTIGYEMGIWIDSNFTLSPLAEKVSLYEITVSELIGTAFLNLFTYFEDDQNQTYHHILYEILKKCDKDNTMNITKDLIADTLPIDDLRKKREQANTIFHYLKDSDLFIEVDDNILQISSKYKDLENLISLCNIEYKNLSFEEAKELFKDKRIYSEYVSKSPMLDVERSFDYFPSSEFIEGGQNLILYGVPGSGKSYTLEKEYINEKTDNYERVVFHPDYSYSDFVGQILPNVNENGQIRYEFVPGPLTNILKSSFEYPKKKHILVIEEINRGNSAAIFGDFFQLLDRLETSEKGWKVGASRYEITNRDVAKALYSNENIKFRFPSNLHIIGTMNTSDQNVFSIDTAFQRRWKMKLIENNFAKVDNDFANGKILDTSVTWKKFCETINGIILKNNQNLLSSEDKRLGVYFISKADLTIDNTGNNNFSEKVLKYLWDDAVKFSRDLVFDMSKHHTLEEVIKAFNSSQTDDRFNVFNHEIHQLLVYDEVA